MTRTNEYAAPDADPSWQMLLVQQLAEDLSSGKLELPSFPDVVIRIRKELGKEDSSIDEVAKVVGTEPALAARMLRLANSAALNRSDKPVTDLRMAITRLGANLVRSSALSFAMHQIRRSEGCREIEADVGAVWKRSTLVAAVSHAVAQRVPGVHADEAMLAGLLHAVGKLYILVRAAGNRAIAGNGRALAEIMITWHANIGKAILEGWGLPKDIYEAVARQDEIDEDGRDGDVTLAEVLATGLVMADYLDEPAGLELAVDGSRWFGRLGLDARSCRAVLAESRQEILDLKRALDG